MTFDPLLPFWLLAALTFALAAFALWRLVVSPGVRLRLAWAMRLVAVLLLAAVAAHPVIPAEPAERAVSEGGLEVYIVVDTTSSMAAEDWAGGAPRLDGVKADIRAIAQRLDGAGFSLVTFDGDVVQRVPLTTDAAALVSAGDVLTQEITAYSRGSSVDEAVPVLADLLGEAAGDNPRQRRVLFYLGDGEQTSGAAPGSFESLAPLLAGGAVLGYGTTQGGAMREFDGGYSDPSAPVRYIQDYSSGSPVDAVSRIDENQLGQIAQQLGVGYTHRTAGQSLDPVLAGFDVGDVTTTDGARGVRTELYWIPAIPLGLIALVEIVLLAGALAELKPRAPRRPAPARAAGEARR
jgi:Ca-activated chloride channel family protein